MKKIRQAIVTLAGHVDHGKTTILDNIRKSNVAKKEPGLITQKISFTLVPSEWIKEKCKKLLERYKIKLEIPGFLFIDTPGHAAFTNLRKRGGSLADLAILVVDINEGVKEQTKESIEILRENKVPFIVALNKIDSIPGWSKKSEDLVENINLQSAFAKKNFDERIYKIINQLSAFGFDPDLFFRVSDFTKKLALVPCSGKTGEGIPELLALLAGLSQRFLKKQLELSDEGKGTILEIKKEKGFVTIEAILYDGTIRQNDQLIIASFDECVEAKVRALFEAIALAKGFKPVREVNAAAGIRMHLKLDKELIPGMPFVVASKDVEKVKAALKEEVKEILKEDKEGLIVKADSLGSLEALLFLLRKNGITVKRAKIGEVTKDDIALALTNLETDPLNAVIVAFNVPVAESDERIKIIKGNVIYKILDELLEWKKEKEIEIEREKLEKLTMPCKIKVLPICFRKSKPAIFGIKVEAGILKPNVTLMNEEGKEIGKIKSMQIQNKSVEKARKPQELAVSMPNVFYGRQIKENQILYSSLSEHEFKRLKENKKYLSAEEINLLKEIAKIKRKTKPTWGV